MYLVQDNWVHLSIYIYIFGSLSFRMQNWVFTEDNISILSSSNCWAWVHVKRCSLVMPSSFKYRFPRFPYCKAAEYQNNNKNGLIFERCYAIRSRQGQIIESKHWIWNENLPVTDTWQVTIMISKNIYVLSRQSRNEHPRHNILILFSGLYSTRGM